MISASNKTSDATGVLRWNEPDGSDITGYQIFINDTIPLLALKPSLELEGLEQSIEYQITGKTIAARGAESPHSDRFTFELGTVGTSDRHNKLPISIWPNPSAQMLFIKISAHVEPSMQYESMR